MTHYIEKEGIKLRLGYTTGSCAAAAAKASAWMLLTGQEKKSTSLMTPKGIELHLVLEEVQLREEWVSSSIRKDGGDDPDSTHGALITAKVSRREEGILIRGGEGVGVVTKRGLDQPPGEAAINSVPRKMIRENLQEVASTLGYQGGFEVVISVPDGAELAKRTFNPRLGIEGGISIIGTSGMVDPMSEKALLDTIKVELRQKREEGQEVVLLTPGQYGSSFLKSQWGISPERAVLTSNFIADSFRLAQALGFRGALLVGHIGKLIKVAAGVTNTHSKYGDGRMITIAAHGAASGLSSDGVRKVLQCVSCDEAIPYLKEEGCFEETFSLISQAMEEHLHYFVEDMEVGMIAFSKVHGELSRTSKASAILQEIVR